MSTRLEQIRVDFVTFGFLDTKLQESKPPLETVAKCSGVSNRCIAIQRGQFLNQIVFILL